MTSPSRLSLFTIEESLQLLAETREAAEAEGDAAAVVECDKALAEYLTSEAAKVDSYAALIRRTTYEAECCASEESRLAARRKQLVAFADRLKANALEVMQRFDVNELKSPTATLRRQANGGITPLEVDESLVPARYRIVSLVMPMEMWNSYEEELSAMGATLIRTAPNTEAIRKALGERVVCPECKGAFMECRRCEGTGRIAVTVPGAKLLPRGEHVRLS